MLVSDKEWLIVPLLIRPELRPNYSKGDKGGLVKTLWRIASCNAVHSFPVLPDLTPAGQLARRLIERGSAEDAGSLKSAQLAAATLDRLYQDLSIWVGLDGCHALFTRALSEAQLKHPLLETIHLHARSSPYLEGVAETIEQHDAEETAEALESMLVILIELMGRLIGDDMATNLIERGFAESAADATRERKRA